MRNHITLEDLYSALERYAKLSDDVLFVGNSQDRFTKGTIYVNHNISIGGWAIQLTNNDHGGYTRLFYQNLQSKRKLYEALMSEITRLENEPEETEEPKTVVIFMYDKFGKFALLPYDLGTYDPNTCGIFTHQGHSAAPCKRTYDNAIAYPTNSVLIADLRDYMTRHYGYNLDVRETLPQDHLEVRKAQLREIMAKG